MTKYAFVDRDGTFLWEPKRPEGVDPRETFPLKSPDDVCFMDGALEGLRALQDDGYTLVLVTNQSHLGTERHPRPVFDAVMERMHEELSRHGLHFAFEIVCPHGPDDGCDCRKPNIGGVTSFLETQNDVDLAHSLMFGDRDTDRQFAENLSVRFVKIETNTKFYLPSTK